MTPRRDEFLEGSGQRWKVYLFLVAMASSALLFLLLIVFYAPGRTRFLVWALSFALVAGAFGLVWIAVAVRCPRCRLSGGWATMKSSSAGKIVASLLQMERCPRCSWPE
jgi:hypothetical protein